MKKLTFSKSILFILPLIFLWVGLNFDRNNYPNDPEYIYLMNALCICSGQSVGHIDNPGTTLMQIGAATIEFVHLISPGKFDSAVEQALNNPDKFIETIRKVIVFLNSLLLLFMAWVVFKKKKSIWTALFFQLSFLLSSYILEVTWAKLSPEPLLFFVSGLYVTLLFLFYWEENKNQWKYAVLFAFITGAGLATKATFLPLVLLPLFILPNIKKKLFFLAGIVPSFVLFTIPAIPEYKSMFFWFRNLIGHSGIYGHGQKGIIDLKTYLPNILSILTNNPLIPIVLIVGFISLLAIFLFRKKGTRSDDAKFLRGLLVTFLFGILLVAKHYGGNHYLMPVILLNGIAFFIVINALQQILNSKKLTSFLLPVIVLFCFVFIAFHHPKPLLIANRQYKAASDEIDKANVWAKKNYADYTRINYYIYSINKFTGLKFGNDFAKGKMLSYLKELFPKTYFYELSSDSYFNWNLRTSLQNIVEENGKKILLMNGPASEEQIQKMEEKGFPLQQVYKGDAQNIFLLDTVKYVPPPKDNLIQFGATIGFNAEEISEDGKYFLGSNSEIFGPVNALSTEQAFSESHSIKLDKSNPFALDYKLTDINVGEIYQIEVWRKSKTSSGFLVVSADNSNDYYQAQQDAIKYGKNGWELLRIKLEITEKLEGKNLKIYLWNPRKRAAFFDDLSIKKLMQACD